MPRADLRAYKTKRRVRLILYVGVKQVLGAGAKAEQTTLGIPLYGRHCKTAERAVSYRELVAKHKLDADTDEVDGVYFNGPATVRRKVGYASEKKPAGVLRRLSAHRAGVKRRR